MRFFFKSRQFKIGVTILAVVLFISLIASFAGNAISPQSSVVGSIIAPFQKMATSISNSFKDLGQKISDNRALILENAQLKEEINRLNNEVADFDAMEAENKFYKDYLEIKEANPDYKFCDATLISRDTTDEFGSFTIDCGSISGIKTYCPVITDAGLVGYISEVGLTTSKVTTLLSNSISIGAIDSRTGDAGVVGGTLDFATKGKTRMYNIRRSSSVAIGDYIVTSGSGVFPSGLLLGKIINVSQEKYSTALYAELEPFVDLEEIRSVMVITDFDGKIDIPSSEETK